jgi:hypothetical protein
MEDQMCTWEPLSGQRSPDRLDARVWALTELMLGGAEVFAHSETDIAIEDFRLPRFWPRVWALDIDGSKASVLWAAHDREADTLYVYSELVMGRHELALVADAIKKRGANFSGMPGLFDHLSRKRTQQEGQRIIDALLDLHLDIFTPRVEPEAAVSEVMRRLSTKRLKVFSTSCPQWLAQYRSYRRNKDGDIVEESDGLMRATDLLVMEAPNVAALDDASVAQAQDDHAASTRNSTTGY